MNFNAVLRRCQKLMSKSHELPDFAAALIDAATAITLSEHHALLMYQPEALELWDFTSGTGLLSDSNNLVFANHLEQTRLPEVTLQLQASAFRVLSTALENEQGQLLGCLVSALPKPLLERQNWQLQLVAKTAVTAFSHNQHLLGLHKIMSEQNFLLALSEVLDDSSLEQIQLALDLIRHYFKADAALINAFSEGYFRSKFASGSNIAKDEIHPLPMDQISELWERIKHNPRIHTSNPQFGADLTRNNVASMVVQNLGSNDPISNLELLWQQPTDFSDEQLRVLTLVSRMLGVAVRHQYAHEKLNWRQLQIKVLGQLSEELHDAQNTQVIAARVMSLIPELMRSSHGTILLLKADHLEIIATRTMIRSAKLLTQTSSIAWVAIELRQLQVVQNDQIEIYGTPTTQLYCPMFNADGQPIGVLICAREENRFYDHEDKQLLEQLSRSVATSIERLRSVEQLQKQLLKHKQLLSLSRLLDSNEQTMPKSQAIGLALEKLRDLVKADYIQVNRRTNLELNLEYETDNSLFPVGFPQQLEVPTWMLEKSETLRAVMSGKTVHLSDTSKYKILRRAMAEVGYRSFWSTNFDYTPESSMQLSIFRCRPGGWNPEEQHLIETAARMLGAVIQRHQNQEQLINAYQAAIHTTGLMLESRDFETKGHTDRVVTLAMRFAARLKLGLQETQDLRWGAYLHDIGKIIIPDQILNKPGRLNLKERMIVESHVVQGEKIALTLPFLSDNTRAVIRLHHERMDGTGYPDKIAGADIPILARMFAICDVYDALRHERPYKAAMSRNDTTLTLLESSEKGHLDPYLIRIFLEMLEEIEIGHTLIS